MGELRSWALLLGPRGSAAAPGVKRPRRQTQEAGTGVSGAGTISISKKMKRGEKEKKIGKQNCYSYTRNERGKGTSPKKKPLMWEIK